MCQVLDHDSFMAEKAENVIRVVATVDFILSSAIFYKWYITSRSPQITTIKGKK